MICNSASHVCHIVRYCWTDRPPSYSSLSYQLYLTSERPRHYPTITRDFGDLHPALQHFGSTLGFGQVDGPNAEGQRISISGKW